MNEEPALALVASPADMTWTDFRRHINARHLGDYADLNLFEPQQPDRVYKTYHERCHRLQGTTYDHEHA